jgi:hypothetical protein
MPKKREADRNLQILIGRILEVIDRHDPLGRPESRYIALAGEIARLTLEP